jgi:hypothetical protein
MTSTPDPDALSRQIFVRHREPGHVRFALPAELCSLPAASTIEAALRRQDGVYRVTIHAAERKLSVFYDEHACDLHAVARRLFAALGELPAGDDATVVSSGEGLATPAASAKKRRAGGGLNIEARAKRALHRMMQEMARHPQLRGVQARVQPILESALTEKAIINFLNDLLAFYLIRVHWDLITQRWLREPLKFRYAWLTIFYLVFLLVRYRKSGDGK